MSSMLKINGKDVNGFFANLLGGVIALVVVICTFLWLALAFILSVLILLSPIILIAALVFWALHH